MSVILQSRLWSSGDAHRYSTRCSSLAREQSLDCFLYSEKSSIFRECHILMYKCLRNHPGIWETSVQYTTNVDCSLTLARQHARVSLCGFLSWLPWNWGAKSKLPFKTSCILKSGNRDKATLLLKVSSPFCRQLRLDFFIGLKMWEMIPTASPLVLIPFFLCLKMKL